MAEHPLFCRDDEDPVAYAALVAVKRAETSLELLDEDLSRIGRALTGGKPFDLRDDYDRRANETLKALIAATRAALAEQKE